MIYINSIEIKNFQSHEDTKLDFHRGLNVIVGRSDSGKTAILRAIKWVFYNDPPPGSLIRHGAKEMSVRIEFNTGAVVTRLWSSRENKYILIKSTGEEIVLEKFNRTVPFEIIQEINIQKVELGSSVKNGINIAEQLDGPFLLTESASVRASAIGRLIGVNFIDDALRDVIKDNKNNSKKLKEAEFDKELLLDDLKGFDYLVDEEKKINFIKDCRDKIENYSSKVENLKQLSNSLKNIDEEIILTKQVLQKYSNLNELENKLIALSSYVDKIKYYSKLSNNILNNNEDIKVSENQIINLKDLDELHDKFLSLTQNIEKLSFLNSLNTTLKTNAERISKGINYLKLFENIEITSSYLFELSKNLEIYSKLLNINKNFNAINSNIGSIDREVKNEEEDILKLTKEYENIFVELGYCPLCHSKIDSSNIAEHIRGEI